MLQRSNSIYNQAAPSKEKIVERKRAVPLSQVLDVIRRAANCRTGMLEYAVPSIEEDAVSVAAHAGYMELVGNGVAQVTAAGREYLS